MASPPQPLLFLVGQPVCFRRMSPQEDLVATLSGIDVLLRQRQELIDRLVGRHKELSRRHEIGALVDFSKQIDAIMKCVLLHRITTHIFKYNLYFHV